MMLVVQQNCFFSDNIATTTTKTKPSKDAAIANVTRNYFARSQVLMEQSSELV
jgi:hypothetical protein